MVFDERVLRRLKLSDLRIFHSVVQRGGMAKAAAHLNISQPAVSKAVAALEHTLEVRLLERSPHGVEVTVYGRALLEGGVAVFDELRQTMKQMAFLADPTGGELHIGSTELGAVALVPAILDQLARQYPRAVFHVMTADTATLTERALPQRTIELAIGAMSEFPASGHIESEILFPDRQLIMAGRKSKWVRRRNIALADVLSEPWILPPPDSIAGRYVTETFQANGVEPPLAQVISFSIPLYHSLVATGHFLTLQPVLMARLAGHLPLKRLDVQFSGVPRSIGVMMLRRRTLSPLAQIFINCARDVAKIVRKASGLGWAIMPFRVIRVGYRDVGLRSDLRSTADSFRTRSDFAFGPATEVAERSFFHFTAHQNALQFAEAKLKNGIYARYFAKIAVCKKEHWIV